ncbi:securin isoform X2 [Hypomesus transpacificus]|uniref:securin isoform X2 n=1 Tax=Hypomesus transpacificus TaxID=137520 RepID=UPI001F07690D|nr:securin isoform X2 [Hypomesus transpacificus]
MRFKKEPLAHLHLNQNNRVVPATILARMASINFAERENARLHAPNLKSRHRLASAPPDVLKTPFTGKKLHTPILSGRKALGAINKIALTPAVRHERTKLLDSWEPKIRTALQTKVDEYPDIERFIPYDPLEFEKYVVPEDVVRLGHLALPGLAFPQTPYPPKEDLEVLETQFLSPIKNAQHPDCSSELDAFLQTINELTVDMPPESPDSMYN